jgi:hypothetical protein
MADGNDARDEAHCDTTVDGPIQPSFGRPCFIWHIGNNSALRIDPDGISYETGESTASLS